MTTTGAPFNLTVPANEDELAQLFLEDMVPNFQALNTYAAHKGVAQNWAGLQTFQGGALVPTGEVITGEGNAQILGFANITGAVVTATTLRVNGTLGIGGQPRSWGNLWGAAELRAEVGGVGTSIGAVAASGSGGVEVLFNSYHDNSNYIALNTGSGIRLRLAGSGLTIALAPSVVAGNPHTHTTILTLTQSGAIPFISLATGADILMNGAGGTTTTMTSGFLYIPSAAGVPTGAPTLADPSRAPLYLDRTNNRLYVRNGATNTWHYAALT